MTDLLTLGASGLRAYSRALGVVGDNIANAQTPGYARRSARIEEGPVAPESVRYRNMLSPSGSLATGVTRAVDQWRVADANASTSDAGQSAAKLEWLSVGETALDNGAGGVGASITAIFNTADRLTADPGSVTLRRQFIDRLDTAATAFRRTAGRLQSASDNLTSDTNTTVSQINTDTIALQKVNRDLLAAKPASIEQASLLDERDRLVGSISANIAVDASYDSRGIATLTIAGSGQTLVAGPVVASVSASFDAAGIPSFSVVGGAGFVPTSGKLAGLSQAASQISGQRTALDTLASQFATQINTVHQAGIDANGNPGAPLIDDAGGAASIAAFALTTAEVAAADATSANGNMLSFASLRGPNGTEAGWAQIVNLQAQTTANARSQDAAAGTRRDIAFDARDAVSAVDLDQEAAELLRFQQVYEGAARVIQVARETMQSILNAV
jgi:flagellar hook-associated protein 1